MNRIIKAVAIAFAAAAGFSPAFAQTAPAPGPSLAAATTGSETRIVPVEGAQDGDMTLEGFEGIACDYVYSEEIVPVGPVFGDAEKDTVARTVAGTDCR